MNIKKIIENHFGKTCPDDWATNPEYKCTLSDVKQILETVCNGIDIIEQNDVDWNIWQNLKSFEEKEQSIWNLRKWEKKGYNGCRYCNPKKDRG